jgi:hypothetical protein
VDILISLLWKVLGKSIKLLLKSAPTANMILVDKKGAGGGQVWMRVDDILGTDPGGLDPPPCMIPEEPDGGPASPLVHAFTANHMLPDLHLLRPDLPPPHLPLLPRS